MSPAPPCTPETIAWWKSVFSVLLPESDEDPESDKKSEKDRKPDEPED